MQIQITYSSFAWSETNGYYRGESIGEILIEAVSKAPFLKGELIYLNFWADESEIKQDKNCANKEVINVFKLKESTGKTIQHIKLVGEPCNREKLLQALATDKLVEQIQVQNDRTIIVVLGNN